MKDRGFLPIYSSQFSLADFQEGVAENAVGVSVSGINLDCLVCVGGRLVELVPRVKHISEMAHDTCISRRDLQGPFERLFRTIEVGRVAAFSGLANQCVAESIVRFRVTRVATEQPLVIRDVIICCRALGQKSFRPEPHKA